MNDSSQQEKEHPVAQSIRDVMTANPATVPASAPITEAARCMKEMNIGDVLVVDKGQVCGVVTDRDIVIRAIAEGRDGATTKIQDVCTKNLVSLAPNDSVDDAVRLMREKAVRRLPVVENGQAVGVVSIGDLAIERDETSALADISAAPPSR